MACYSSSQCKDNRIVKYTGKLCFVQETQKQSLHQHLKIAQQFLSEEKEVIGL